MSVIMAAAAAILISAKLAEPSILWARDRRPVHGPSALKKYYIVVSIKFGPHDE